MVIILYLYQSAFAQSQQLKHQSNVGNLFKVNNKDTRATSSRHSVPLFKVNNGNATTMCKIYSKLTIKTPRRRE